MLKRMVQARALMYRRDSINDEDLEMAARTAFASIPQWRQPITKMLCNPDHSGPYKSSDVEERLDVSRNTALERMREAGRIGIGRYENSEEDRSEPSRVCLNDITLRGIFGDADRVPWPFE
jgi:hypothetical protein